MTSKNDTLKRAYLLETGKKAERHCLELNCNVLTEQYIEWLEVQAEKIKVARFDNN